MRRAAILAAAALPLAAIAQPEPEAPAAQVAPADLSDAELIERLRRLTGGQPRDHRLVVGRVTFEAGQFKIHNRPDGTRPMRRDIQRVLNAGQPIVVLIREGARRQRLDLGVAPIPVDAEGAELDEYMQIASALRQAYRLLRLDIGWRLEDGALDSAIERIEAGLGFSAAIDESADLLVHQTRHGLVGLMLEAAQDAAAHPDITPLHRKRLLDQINRFDPVDPFDYGAAIVVNSADVIRWLRAECSGPEAGERLADIIEENGVPPDPDMLERMRAERKDGDNLSRWVGHMAIIAWPERPAAKLSEAEIAQRIDAIEALLDTLHAAWASPAEGDALDAVFAQMERDDSQIATFLARLSAAMPHSRQSAAEQLAQARKTLRQ